MNNPLIILAPGRMFFTKKKQNKEVFRKRKRKYTTNKPVVKTILNEFFQNIGK